MPNLTGLMLRRTDVSDQSLATLASSVPRNLEYLGLSETSVSGKGIAKLLRPPESQAGAEASHTVGELYLRNCLNVDDEIVEVIADCADLKGIDLIGTAVTADGVAHCGI